MAAPVLPPFAARPLRPILSAHTVSSGHLEPLGSQPVATGGWPAPLRRTASFVVIFRAPQPVNLVQGVPAVPGNSRRKR